MKLKDRVAIITGAGRGIGRAIALAFAKEGANLALNILGENGEEDMKIIYDIQQLGQQAFVVKGDITDLRIVKQLVEQTINVYGKIDILVNNAGILFPGLIHELTIELWDRAIEVNLKSVFLTTRYVVPYMIEQRFGRIINISSQLGQRGAAALSHYAAAKAGVIGFTKSIARELGSYGITVNCIAPGPTETDMLKSLSEEWKERRKSELSIPRFASVEEIAPTAVFLASEPDGNAYTGQTLGPNLGDVML